MRRWCSPVTKQAIFFIMFQWLRADMGRLLGISSSCEESFYCEWIKCCNMSGVAWEHGSHDIEKASTLSSTASVLPSGWCVEIFTNWAGVGDWRSGRAGRRVSCPDSQITHLCEAQLLSPGVQFSQRSFHQCMQLMPVNACSPESENRGFQI